MQQSLEHSSSFTTFITSEIYTTTQLTIPFLFALFLLVKMINTKKLLKMAKKWQQRAALKRKRISFQRSTTTTTTTTTTSSSTAVEKGCFVVYTVDKIRFAFPLSYLNNSVFEELLKISEEEFGLRAGGPITLPFDSVFLEYLIKFIERRMDGDTEKALLMSISSARCSMQPQEQQSGYTQQLLVF
ncbi:putative small auxin-up RNA [Arabidopsis thaliana]